MGILAGLSVALRKCNGEMILRGASEKNIFLLKMLGLQPLVRIEQASDVPGNVACSLLASGVDKTQMTQAMINAHEALIEVAPDNIVKFKDVLAYLKEDLNRTVVQPRGMATSREG